MSEFELPSIKNENFRFVSLRDIAWKPASKNVDLSVKPLDWDLQADDQGLRVLLSGSNRASEQLKISDHDQISVTKEPFPVFESFRDDFFSQVLPTEICDVIRIPKGFVSAKTLRLSECFASSAEIQARYCVLLIGEQADVKILDDLSCDVSVASRAVPVVSFLHLEVSDGSRVKLFVEQALSSEAVFSLRHSAVLSRDAHLSYWAYHRGANKGQHRVECLLAGEGAASEINFGVKARGKEAIDLWVCNHHVVKNTASDTKAWNVVDDEAIVVFNGNIKISPEGLYTQAYQSNKNLLLSDRAQVHSMPKLEIATDDVKCSHGASVASLDADQLFYLQCRGIEKAAAERMLLDAFAFPILSQIPIESVKRKYLSEEGEVL